MRTAASPSSEIPHDMFSTLSGGRKSKQQAKVHAHWTDCNVPEACGSRRPFAAARDVYYMSGATMTQCGRRKKPRDGVSSGQAGCGRLPTDRTVYVCALVERGKVRSLAAHLRHTVAHSHAHGCSASLKRAHLSHISAHRRIKSDGKQFSRTMTAQESMQVSEHCSSASEMSDPIRNALATRVQASAHETRSSRTCC